jgi:NADPH2:quinone reductase
MSRGVRTHEFGGPEVLRSEDTQVGAPGPRQVRPGGAMTRPTQILYCDGRHPASSPSAEDSAAKAHQNLDLQL